MPTLTPDELRRLEDLSYKYRIKFCGEIRPIDWPEYHRETLGNAKKLADKKYDVYATDATPSENPWKRERMSHAVHLVQRARRSRSRNESSWRHACESFILSRLLSESGLSAPGVAVGNRSRARRCKQRIDRSKRPPKSSTAFLETIGLNQIFTFTADEQVRNNEGVFKDLGKRERPDRVYGLRETKNIELLMYDIKNRHLDPAVNSNIHPARPTPSVQFTCQPISPKGDRLLFPFLVLEAKNGGSTEWQAIDMQTAFSIRAFLETQRQLYCAASSQSDCRATPLVWFFSNKGEDWRLCAAFTENDRARSGLIGTIDYRVIDVWRGCITTRDAALQLLLLVDYIFDWARDIYREDVIRALRVVVHGANDTMSEIFSDTAILSTRPLESHNISQTEEDCDYSSYISAQKSFIALDSFAGKFRHANFVESRYRCIFINDDNVQTLLDSTAENQVQQLSRLILGQMSHSILINQQTLDKMEEEWTGTCRSLAPLYRFRSQGLHIVTTFSTYISTDWHQVRELSVIAITRDAWPTIAKASGWKRKQKHPEMYDYRDEAAMLKVIKRLRAGSPQQILLAAITRTSFRVECAPNHSQSLGVIIDNGLIRDIVCFVYASFKKGTLEPEETFLRLSRRYDQQNLLRADVDPFQLPEQEPLQTSHEGCVLLTATCPPKDQAGRKEAQICAYLTDGNSDLPSAEVLAQIVKNTFESRDVYHTTRSTGAAKFWSLTQKGTESHGIWNIRRVYGVYSYDFAFCSMLKTLQADTPVTQGASRSPNDNGSHLYRRNITPWQDRRYVYLNSQSRMFILYKIFTKEIAYWRRLAEERKRDGVLCCPCCATIGDDEMCSTCNKFLAVENQYDWLRNAILGHQPLEIKNLTEEEIKGVLATLNTDYPCLREDILPWSQTVVGGFDGNLDWTRKLDFYAGLNTPFEDMLELFSQWRLFRRFCDKNGPYYNFRNHKRKRSSSSDSEESYHSNSEAEL
ncbi:hypothetical protein F5Y08DRAFT_355490 [Xylaria arbuscula]|nr:hypothetical protein F5Y08DRAFT_355490 [Xylaria arbuscula]